MNYFIEDSLIKLDSNEKKVKILPHQLATIDFIYKNIIQKKENVLLFHKMGSGKTIISLISAFLLSKQNKHIYIVLPNLNIKNLWLNQIYIVQLLLPFDNYNIDNIIFLTKTNFIEDLDKLINNKQTISLNNLYNDGIIIIDEAHNFFGNNSTLTLNKLNELVKVNYILVTGSPILNTITTLKDLLSIISNTEISDTDYMIQYGKKVFSFELTEKGIELINKTFKNKISYYNQDIKDIPKSLYIGKPIIKIPIIPCLMSKNQTKTYNNIKSKIDNEMFLKYLLVASFLDIGNLENISNFEKMIFDKKYHKLTDTLYINNGVFQGSELKNLNNSCKIKYFVDHKIYNEKNLGKAFVYFSNSTIGGRFLIDVMKNIGVKEYGKETPNNFICYNCKKKRTCKQCKPMTYIIITSKYISLDNNTNSINTLLDIYNLPNNDNGEVISILFGSKIISESYTLKEVKELWFLTIPDSLSEMLQINARCLRNFSYKNINNPVKFYLLTSVTEETKINKLLKSRFESSINLTEEDITDKEDIKKYTKILETEDNFYTYDIKKILYLEIKSSQTNKIHNIFKSLSYKYKLEIQEDLIPIYLLEIIRSYGFMYKKFSLQNMINTIPNQLLPHSKIRSIINKMIKDNIIIKNKNYSQCVLQFHNNTFSCIAIKIKYNNYGYRIKIN